MYEQLGKDVARRTNGDLTIKVYAGGSLGAGPFQQYKRAVEGVADISDICHAFHAKVFAKTMLIVQPGAATTASDATNRLWSVPEALMASDYKEVKNVYMYSVPQATLISRDKPVRTLADLKGVKVMTPGAAFAPIVAAVGRLAGADGPQRHVQRAVDRRGRHGGADPDRPDAALADERDRQIRHRRRFRTAQSLRRDHEQGELRVADPVAEGGVRQAHRQDARAQGREDLRRLGGRTHSSWRSDSNEIELIQLSPEVRKALFDAAKPALEKTLAEFEKDGSADIRAAYQAMNK